MDAAIADTINRRDVKLICARLDALDLPQYNDRRNTCACVHCAPFLAARHGNGCSGYHCSGSCIPPGSRPWYRAPLADTLMRDDDASRADRAWLVGALASPCPGVAFDGAPADCDWDNFFSHFRVEILARRGPQIPSVREAVSGRHGVGSQ